MGFGEVICSTTESARYFKEKLSAIKCGSRNVDVQWNNMWVTARCYYEITTTVSTLSVFILG
jgi:hypothetical protein